MQFRITPEEICKKLRPIFGRKIDMIYLKYSLAQNREDREQIEQALKIMYEKYLNTNLLSDKILLEPPSENAIKAEYPLGHVVYADEAFYPFGLREQDWIRHMCITGMSGSGKTNLAFQVLGNLIKKGKPFIVFDWKKSFRPLLLVDNEIMLFTVGNEKVSNFFKLNINIPPKGIPPKEWISVLCDLITESFFASYGTHKIILETLDKAFEQFGVYEGSGNFPTWHQIKDRLEKKADAMKGGREAEWMESALRIAHALTFGGFGEVVNCKDKTATKIEDVLGKKAIFELNSLNNSEKKFLCEFLLTYIYKYKKANQQEAKDKFESAILVDEAHNIFLKDKTRFLKESVTDMVYREIREFGIALICLDQHISKLSETVAGNSATNIAFQQVLPEDVNTIAGIMQLIENKRFFSMLPVGHAVVKLAERYYLPFLIKVPFIELKKENITDQEINESMRKLMKVDEQLKEAERTVEKEELVKKLGKIERIYQHAGVEVKKPFIVNHLQDEIVEIVKKQMSLGFNLGLIKEQLMKLGYNGGDVLRAIRKATFHEKAFDVNETLKEQPEMVKFLKHLSLEPLATYQLYKRMGMSVRRCDALKNKLQEMGLIEVRNEITPNARRKVLLLTPQATKVMH